VERPDAKLEPNPLEQKCSHEAGSLFAFLQGSRENLRRLIGEIEGVVGPQSQSVKPDPGYATPGFGLGWTATAVGSSSKKLEIAGRSVIAARSPG